MSRKRLAFKEESYKPNFDKAKICKYFGIALSSLYKIFLKKSQFYLRMKAKLWQIVRKLENPAIVENS